MRFDETGRSMIEMLGVLAIIGVLSVGGIAGYSKAMDKFRVNKTIDQVSQIVTNIRVLFGSQKNYEGLGSGGADETGAMLIHNADLFPDEMIMNHANKLSDFANPYAGSVDIYASARFQSSAVDELNGFVLVYSGVPQAACIDLASQEWNASIGTGLIAFGVNAPAVGNRFADWCSSSLDGNKAIACVGDMPMKVAWAAAACKKGSKNSLYWKFY